MQSRAIQLGLRHERQLNALIKTQLCSKMSRKPASLKETQENFEQRFNCMVCLCARLEMVSGLCQHRVCVECLYDDQHLLRKSFEKCPICQLRHTFPSARPEIPEDNVEMMWCLGVRACPNHEHGCTSEMWEWEIEDHLQSCPWKASSPKKEVSSLEPKHSGKKRTSKPRRPVTRTSGNVYNFRSHSYSK